VRIARLAERQTDLEEVLNGPPISAAFGPDGTPTPAAVGFAAKNGTEVSALERVQTPKGTYLAYRRKQRGRAAVDVLPSVLGGTLRGLSFPKLMHWDAMLEDGKGELLFGRPIRWLLFTYGGRVVPFGISRTPGAQSGSVQDVTSGAVTYGHRFLTTSGRAGRAIKVRSFDEYKARLLENFVILERSERHNKIARELDAKAQRLQGRVSRVVRQESGLLGEVPDLVEYPSVIAGTFAPEFLELPEEVLTTTLIHHQHYFPVESEDGRLKTPFSPSSTPSLTTSGRSRATPNGSCRRGCGMPGSSGRQTAEPRSSRGWIGWARSCFTRSSEATVRRRTASNGLRGGLPRKPLAQETPSRSRRPRPRAWRRRI
jgi:glycyl-tRNA synthetase beta chain